MERLTGLDASFLYMETPSLHMHIGMVMVFDPSTMPGGYSFSKVRDRFAERTRHAPVFQRRLVQVPFRISHPVWVDDTSFDIDYHIRRTSVPAPGGLHELADLAGDILGRQLDRYKPLWRVWVVENLEHGRIGLITKVHHATVDGVSGAELMSVLFDLEPDPPPMEPPDPGRIDTRVPSDVELVGQALLARATRPFELARVAVKTSRRVLDVRNIRQLHAPGIGKAALPMTAPRTSINAAITPHRTVAFASIGLDDVKRVKNAMKTTVNDVILAVCTGALRKYLLDGGELPDRPLVSVVPVSVRPSPQDQFGANRVSTLFINLPTEEPDPVKRLLTIREDTKGAKKEHHALGAETLLNWAENATPNVFAVAARVYTRMRLADRHRPIANLVTSNVPGPDFPLYLSGAELTAAFPLGPVLDGMGLNVTIMSYRGVLNWGLIACSESVPRIWELAAALPAALDELLDGAGLEPATYRAPIGEIVQAVRPPGTRIRTRLASGRPTPPRGSAAASVRSTARPAANAPEAPGTTPTPAKAAATRKGAPSRTSAGTRKAAATPKGAAPRRAGGSA